MTQAAPSQTCEVNNQKVISAKTCRDSELYLKQCQSVNTCSRKKLWDQLFMESSLIKTNNTLRGSPAPYVITFQLPKEASMLEVDVACEITYRPSLRLAGKR